MSDNYIRTETYKVFLFRLDASFPFVIRIVDIKEFSSLGEALNSVCFDDDLFEVTIEVPWDGVYDDTRLKTVARSASMCAYYNTFWGF